jgi:hypothetical protein
VHLRLLAAAVTAGLALSALSACSDDPEPILTPAPTETPTTATPSPTESESAEPEEPKEFIRRWVEVGNQMQNGGTTKAYRRLSPRCEPCLDLADRIDGFLDAGGFVRTEGWTILTIADPIGTERMPVFAVEVDAEPTEYQESAGTPTHTLPGGRSRYEVTLEWRADRWFARDLRQLG